MTGKELLLAALRNQPTPRPAWVPFVGVHGAKLLGVTAPAYLRDAKLMAAGIRKARDLYQADGMPICFDLQLEAEVLGCELDWPEEGVPAVKTHPLAEGKSLADLPQFDVESGRFPVVLEALRLAKAELGGETALYGLICGPFTLALHLLGNDLFMEMYDRPDYVKAVVAYGAAVGCAAAAAYVENGADAVAVVDPMTSQISPEHFREFVAPYVDLVFRRVRELGAFSSLFVCGDATRNLEEMSRTACDNISIDENIPLEKLRDITRASGKSFGGNLKLTSVLLLGDEDDGMLDAIRCLDVGGSAGFVLAPGCDLPFATPEKNLQAVARMVHDGYAREVARRTVKAKDAGGVRVSLPDYASEKEVFADVVTLDSASCAPCQYMMDAMYKAAKAYGAPLVIREHKITTREGLAVMAQLGVANIPTICLDGKPEFVSLIPDQNTLVKAIAAAAARKGARSRT